MSTTQLSPVEVGLAVSESQENYEQFVSGLASPPGGFNLSAPGIAFLVSALRSLGQVGLALDHSKRVITYGEKLRAPEVNVFEGIQPFLVNLGTERETCPLTTRQATILNLFHALLGKLTEAIELAPILLQIIELGEADWVNLIEELGDDDFYHTLAEMQLAILADMPITEPGVRPVDQQLRRAVLSTVQEQGQARLAGIKTYVRFRNGRKLGARYKGGFTKAAALNRDLDAERQELGGEA